MLPFISAGNTNDGPDWIVGGLERRGVVALILEIGTWEAGERGNGQFSSSRAWKEKFD